MIRWPLQVYREFKQQIHWYRQWSILGESVRRFRRIPDKKPWHVMLRELTRCTLHYRCIPDQYFHYEVYRTAVPTENVLDYVPDYVIASKWFPVVNNHYKQHQLLLNNKIFFKQFLRQAGLPVAPAHLYILNGAFYTPDMEMMLPDEALDRLNACPSRRLFCKSDIAEGANGIVCFERSSPDEPFRSGDTVLDAAWMADLPTHAGYLFEEGVEQHPALAGLFPGSLNTFRIITHFTPHAGARVLYTVLRMGTGECCFDNICTGGVFIAIDPVTGDMLPPAYDKHRDTYDAHPTTGISFSDMPLPFYPEAAEMACRAACLFPTLPSIGWDIGYTTDGPVFIEGNDRWGSLPYQLAIGGIGPLLRREWFPDGNVPR